jgi:integrase
MHKPQSTRHSSSSQQPAAASSQPAKLHSSAPDAIQRAYPEVRLRSGKDYADPSTYAHRWPSLDEYARLLVLRYTAPRTRYSYYRSLRLIMDHFQRDPASLSETDLADYLIHVRMQKGWQPKTIRQTVAAARVFFHEMLRHSDWRVLDQVKTKDPQRLPAVLTREQVRALLAHIRLRRYRTPLKLIYCCGLRLSECLNLTVHDIDGSSGSLRVRGGKGAKDLRSYWAIHRHPVLLFPHVGRGDEGGGRLRERMRAADRPMPHN